MKLAKAKRNLIARGTIVLISGPDEEWLSDGLAAWRCTEMGLKKDNVRAIMEITDKQVGAEEVIELNYSMESRWTGYYDAHFDISMKDEGLVLVDGVEYRMLTALEPDERAPQPVYIREADVNPVRLSVGTPEYNLRVSDEEYAGGRRTQLVAVCYDLTVCALIAPEGRGRSDDTGRKYGADRIEQRIAEIYALTHGGKYANI